MCDYTLVMTGYQKDFARIKVVIWDFPTPWWASIGFRMAVHGSGKKLMFLATI